MIKSLTLNNIFLFLFLILFPFGQIIRIGIIHPLDVVVGIAAIYSIIKKQAIPQVFHHFSKFLFFVVVSWLFSFFIFNQSLIFYGLLYMFRLIAYSYFLIYVWNCINSEKRHKLILSALLSISIISALFGWLQLSIFPDLKPLFIWGWDIHLYRLAGTFLDPTFLGLIIVFGLLVSINQFIDTKNNYHLPIITFLLISLAFTYSRASFLAFLIGAFFVATKRGFVKQIVFLTILLISLVVVLPTAKNNSIKLFRSFSAVARIENYKSTIQIFNQSPVFGIGYDNLCIAYRKFIGFQKFNSHACSGSDSSLLFILATTGVVGFIVFIYSLVQIKVNLKRNSYYTILSACFIALMVHSLFSNSMFYPWIMGWMVILLAEV